MLKSQLVDRLFAKLSHLSVHEIVHGVNVMVESMRETLEKNGRIEIRGFGSFAAHYNKPRKARNPKTGQKLTARSKYRVRFKQSKKLKEEMN